jgi:Tol biopolymer transport system component
MRTLETATWQPLAGTGNALYPFWAPDGRSVGFFVDGEIRRLDLDGNLVRRVASATVGVGGTWSRKGDILFAPNPASAIYRVGADGGAVVAVTTLGAGDAGHAFPSFLPDGRHFLYFVVGSPEARGVYLGTLDAPGSTRLFEADAPAAYDSGRLFVLRNGTIYTQAFDVETLTLQGSPAALAEGAMANTGYYITVSAGGGTVAFRAGSGRRQRQFARVDRAGRETARLGEPDEGNPVGPSPSPDATRFAVFRRGATDSDVWLFDSARGVLSRFTTAAGEDIFPSWSRDGSRIAYLSNRDRWVALYQKATTGSGAESLLLAGSAEETFPSDWTMDGTLIFDRRSTTTGWDVWALPAGSGAAIAPVVQTEADERAAKLSPDGHWIAYMANTTGRYEVYVQAFPAGRTTQVSAAGGTQVRWRADGRELFYLDLKAHLVAVPVGRAGADGTLDLGTGVSLFTANVGQPLAGGPNGEYVPAADGQSFVMNLVIQDPRPVPIRLVINAAR